MDYMKKLLVQSVVWKEEGQFVAQCLSIDVSSFGKTKEEALRSLDEALSLYFEDASPKEILKIQGIEIEPRIVKYA